MYQNNCFFNCWLYGNCIVHISLKQFHYCIKSQLTKGNSKTLNDIHKHFIIKIVFMLNIAAKANKETNYTKWMLYHTTCTLSILNLSIVVAIKCNPVAYSNHYIYIWYLVSSILSMHINFYTCYILPCNYGLHCFALHLVVYFPAEYVHNAKWRRLKFSPISRILVYTNWELGQ